MAYWPDQKLVPPSRLLSRGGSPCRLTMSASSNWRIVALAIGLVIGNEWGGSRNPLTSVEMTHRCRHCGKRLEHTFIAQHGHADLIAANNVLAQVPALNDFVAGMAYLLAPEGVITLEVPYLERLITENQFDTPVTVETIAAANGLVAIDVEVLATHGGSFRIYLARLGSRHQLSSRVRDVLAQERRAGLVDGPPAPRCSQSVSPAPSPAPNRASSRYRRRALHRGAAHSLCSATLTASRVS